MLIDCHAHGFADKIAAKAVAQLVSYYRLPTRHTGTLDDLLAEARQASFDAVVLLVAATKPEQVRPAHDFILSIPPATLNGAVRVVRFGTFHVADPHWQRELRRLRQAGIKGIKLHPEFQGIDLADPRLAPFFEEIQDDFILMTHVGDPQVRQDNPSTPRKVAAILDHFPRLRVVAAHMGGAFFWEDALECLAGRRVWFDTASSLQFMAPELIRRLVNRHGTERLMLGSDYPLLSPGRALALLEEKMPWLTGTAKAAVIGGNCANLLGLK